MLYSHPTELLPATVTLKVKRLKGGDYDGQTYGSITTFDQFGIGSSISRRKRAYRNKDALTSLRNAIQEEKKFAEVTKTVGEIGGAVHLMPTVKTLKELIEAAKNGIKPNPKWMFIVAATALYIEGMKADASAEELSKVVATYISIHSTATNPNATPANGIYEITTTSFSGGTGGGIFISTTSYYDITTKQYLGETHSY